MQRPHRISVVLLSSFALGYTQNPQALVRDLKVGKSRFQALADLLRGKADRE